MSKLGLSQSESSLFAKGCFQRMVPNPAGCIATILAAIIALVGCKGCSNNSWNLQDFANIFYNTEKRWIALSNWTSEGRKYELYGDGGLLRLYPLEHGPEIMLKHLGKTNSPIFEAQILVPEYVRGCIVQLAVKLPNEDETYLSAGIGSKNGEGQNHVYSFGEIIGEEPEPASEDPVQYTWRYKDGVADYLERLSQHSSNALTIRLELDSEKITLSIDEDIKAETRHGLAQVEDLNEWALYTEGCQEVNFICPRVAL